MVPYVLPSSMVKLRKYLDRTGRTFAAWSDRFNREASVEVATALARMQHGNLGAFTSIRLISDQATGFTFVTVETGLRFYLPE
jgi:hypothetical protein